ncbi:MAG: SCO family protein [Rhodobacterales bacterium]|nr:MAG: SCO family protein [Rhodobacterales bacterium]
MRKGIMGIAVLALLGVAGAAWWLGRDRPDDPFSACRTSSLGTGLAVIGGPLSLIDENGVAVTEQDIFIRPTLLYFGYTFCPDVCPLDNARNAEALDLLKAEGYDAQMAFISVDPERDDPEQMRDFTDFLHPDAYGLTGSMEQILAASKAYKTYFKKEDNADPEYYLIDHSTFTYLVLPEIGVVEFFKRETTPQEMAERAACFMDTVGKYKETPAIN